MDDTLDANGNHVFNVTSFKSKTGSTLTISCDAAGDSVVLNCSAAVQVGGSIVCTSGAWSGRNRRNLQTLFRQADSADAVWRHV